MNSKQPLLLFDANEVLYRKCKECPFGKGMKCIHGGIPYAYKRIYVCERPGIRQFLLLCKKHYIIGIFSSTTSKNLVPMLKMVGIYDLFTIIFDRAWTDRDPKAHLEGREPWATVKCLETIWHSSFNDNKQWNKSNTIIVDNTLTKIDINDQKNIICINSWLGNDTPHTLKRVRSKIHKKFRALRQYH